MPFLYQVIQGMEVLCQVGNKSPSKPQNFYKDLHLFHILREWINLYLISHSFGDNVDLTQPDNSLKPYGSA